jgi:hypothetical protein
MADIEEARAKVAAALVALDAVRAVQMESRPDPVAPGDQGGANSDGWT